jgi:hypothetical protein
MDGVPRTMSEFWPFYLHEHSRPGTRALHLAGTTLALTLVAVSLVLHAWWLLAGALLSGYAFAWVAHFFVEHNRPATFKAPWKSLASDWRMWGLWVTFRLGRELRRHGLR